MKRTVAIIAVLFTAALWAGASEKFFDELTDAQRYDLADAYTRVADRFDELGQNERAGRFRALVDVIFPGFAGSERPEEPLPSPPRRPERPAPDPSGGDASYYYFNKLLRGVFNENIPLILSAIGDVLYLPMFDEGVDKSTITAELDWFFDNYDVEGTSPGDVFDMDSVVVTPLDNGYWRLEVKTRPEYTDAVPEVAFWAPKMGFYFRLYPEGWRLAAIGPVA